MRSRYSVLLAVLALPGLPAGLQGQTATRQTIDPPALPAPHGYSHIVVVPAGRRAIISGQVAVDSTGAVVGAGDFRAQCVQVFENLRRALRSMGASFDDVVVTTMYVTDLSHLDALRGVRARYLPAEHPPASTLVQVTALYRPELMVEIAAEVALPPAAHRPTTGH